MDSPGSIVLDCQRVGHYFGTRRILHDIQLQIRRGEFVALVGPSGSGKSTLLRAILGTHPPREGAIYMHGKLHRSPNRHCGIVYQRYSLFPFLTAEGNVAIGPYLDKTNFCFRVFRPLRTRRFRDSLQRRAVRLLTRLRLGEAANHYPTELSGGMQQRVAIAQALIMKPQLLLLDEPFGALDEATREEMQTMLLRLYQINQESTAQGRPAPYTLLIVTHELNEAIYVGSRVIGLSQFHPKGNLGATIVYDQSTPIFAPGEIPDFEQFRRQREEIREAVFEPKPDREPHGFVARPVLAGKTPAKP